MKFNLGLDTRLYNHLDCSCMTEVQHAAAYCYIRQLVTAYINGRQKNRIRRKGQRKKKGKKEER